MTESPFEPTKPEQFERDLATRINQVMADPDLQKKFGRAGRKRAREKLKK
jgi:starch synthase